MGLSGTCSLFWASRVIFLPPSGYLICPVIRPPYQCLLRSGGLLIRDRNNAAVGRNNRARLRLIVSPWGADSPHSERMKRYMHCRRSSRTSCYCPTPDYLYRFAVG